MVITARKHKLIYLNKDFMLAVLIGIYGFDTIILKAFNHYNVFRHLLSKR
jgi:hypothetical protein